MTAVRASFIFGSYNFFICLFWISGAYGTALTPGSDADRANLAKNVISVAVPISGVVQLPCMLQSLNRTGRIQVTRRDLQRNNEIRVFLDNCPGGSFFYIISNLVQAGEGLYLNYSTSNTLLSGEEITVLIPNRYGTRSPITFKKNQTTASHLVPPNSVGEGVLLSLKNQVQPVTVSHRYYNSRTNITTLNPQTNTGVTSFTLPDSIIFTIDYTIVYQAANEWSLRGIVEWFEANYERGVDYCKSLGGFVPTDMCRANANTDFMVCPQYLDNDPSTPWIKKAACLTGTQVLSQILSTSRPYYWNTTPSSSSYDNMDYNIKIGVASVCTVVTLIAICCSIMRYCANNSTSTTGSNPRPVPVRDRAFNSAASSRRSSDAGPQVFAARNNILHEEHGLPTYDVVQKSIDAPPSYEEAYKLFGGPGRISSPAKSDDSEEVAMMEVPTPIFVIPRPSSSNEETFST